VDNVLLVAVIQGFKALDHQVGCLFLS